MSARITCPICKRGKAMMEDGEDETELGTFTYWLCTVCKTRLPRITAKQRSSYLGPTGTLIGMGRKKP